MKLNTLFATATAVLGLCGAFQQFSNPTAEQLGEKLFFDPILSADSTVRCASCHIPEFGFADTLVLSRGVGGRLGKRNAQGITNMSGRPHFFYDGRAASLEDQVLMPIQDTLEMRANLELVTRRLQKHPLYSLWFEQVYHAPPNSSMLAQALAAYVRTLETANTPFDRWMRDKPNPMSDAAVRGRRVFMNKGKCFDCHFSPDFTGDEFRNIGLYNGKNLSDKGRYNVSQNPPDLGKFKVPGLRNVAVTAPFMHNGMFKTLEEVIDYYDEPDRFVPDAINRDSLLAQPLHLTLQEKSDLKAFLEALTDDRWSKKTK
ncbi:MAG: cytochrome-c peroxidase [Bacteroidetes bacterium]|nr:cytochrome-c peroxidase [Bacteroidota bacterium]